MTKPRKENRLYLRFKDSDILDDLEILAAKNGLRLPEWARLQLVKKLFDQEFHELLFLRAVESTFVTQKMVEQLCTPEQIQNAKEQARDHMAQLEKHVRSQ